ncbi:MaoC family dehydratase [Oricola indica]|uniref:MaoC family dehydratase n=1 Tax=Oricola indica TaxID=2872591 RepID=UPI003CCBB656
MTNSDVQDALYLDDFFVGQRFEARGEYPLDTETIRRFASEYDPQPFHTDDEAAKDSFFRGLAASGWQVASLTMKLLVESGPKIAGGMIGAGGEIAWPQPTRPGDVLRVTSEVLAVKPSRSKPDRGFATVRHESRNQNGELLQTFTVNMLVFRRPD